ncbi:MAG TPA: methyltransferase domain-containing protein [Rubrobacteraceae bacterium]|nr:methyltransferase domain-containing protein [Rubrobacteraceae bacterium]
MTEPVRDRWAEWLLERRDGGDPVQQKASLEFLFPIRDRVLENAGLSGGETLLDVGAGDGLIAFGALDIVGKNGRLIFGDISQDLLDHSKKLAGDTGVLDRCRFLRASADDLGALEDESVDAVTTRSVLIYVEDKRRAFEEFYRVLKSGGRLSIAEPINSFTYPEPEHLFMGYDVTPVQDLARKVRAVYERIQPPGDPMMDFDERDLADFADAAGFSEVHLTLEISISRGNPSGILGGWDRFIRWTGNPKVPSLGEAMNEALIPHELERLESHLRPLVERAERVSRDAFSYLWAVK